MPTADFTRPSLRIDRHYDAPIDKVWRAWTDPQALMAWFGPSGTEAVTLAETDVRVGGRYRLVFRTEDGQVHDVSGLYCEVEWHRRLVFTWAWRSTPERESRVTLSLAPEGQGTALSFLHEQFFDEATRDDHGRGWAGAFERLRAALADG